MKITWEQIEAVNKETTSVDVSGKGYVVVPQRVKAFRKLYPNGRIETEILSNENGIVVMQTSVYDDENNLLSTGLAYEEKDHGFVNKTSYIENCETSAVGRALGFIGLGIDEQICSAEELINAVTNQDQTPQYASNETRTGNGGISDKQIKYIQSLYDESELERVYVKYHVDDLHALTKQEANKVINEKKKN